MNDVQRQLYINKHTGETACYISRRKIILLENGFSCKTESCLNSHFCNKIKWVSKQSKHKVVICGDFIRRQHTLTPSQRHLFSLSMVGKPVATTYTKKTSTIVNSRICPEVEKCGYNSYCKGILVTLQKGIQKPLYEIKCELDLRYPEESKL